MNSNKLFNRLLIELRSKDIPHHSYHLSGLNGNPSQYLFLLLHKTTIKISEELGSKFSFEEDKNNSIIFNIPNEYLLNLNSNTNSFKDCRLALDDFYQTTNLFKQEVSFQQLIDISFLKLLLPNDNIQTLIQTVKDVKMINSQLSNTQLLIIDKEIISRLDKAPLHIVACCMSHIIGIDKMIKYNLDFEHSGLYQLLNKIHDYIG